MDSVYQSLTFYDLPDEVLCGILSNLPHPIELAKTRRVCKKWNQIASDNKLWMIHFRNYFRSQESYLEKHFKRELDNTDHDVNDNSNSTENVAFDQDASIDWLQAFSKRILIDQNIKNKKYHLNQLKSPFLKGMEPFHYKPDSNVLVTGDITGRVKVFQGSDSGFELKHNLKLQSGIIWWIDVVEDMCIPGGADTNIPVFDINTGEVKKTFAMPQGSVWGLGCSAKDDMLVAGGDRGMLVCFSISTGVVSSSNIGSPIYDLCIVGDGLVAIAAVSVGFLGVWNLKTKQQEYTLPGHTDTVICLVYKDNLLLSSDYDGNLFIWDLASRKSIREFTTEGGQAWSLGLFENIVAAGVMGSEESFIRLFDFNTSQQLYNIPISISSNLGRITCMYMMPTGIVCSCGELWHVDFRNKEDQTGGKYNPFLLEW